MRWLVWVLTVSMLAGCWDNIDIERRALVLGALVDLVPVNPGRGSEGPWELTLEMPILRRMAMRPGGGGGGGEQSDTLPTWRLTVTGATFAEAMRKAATRSERQLFFGHQKVLLIGQELARQRSLAEVLDFWARNRESYLAITVLLAADRAEKIFSAQPRFARSVSMFLQEQSERQIRTSRFVKHNLSEVWAALHGDRDILLSRVSAVPGQEPLELQVSGTGVIREGKLVGWLSPEETQAALWMAGETRGGEIIALPVPELQRVFSLELYRVKNKVEMQKIDDKPGFTVKLNITADVIERMGYPEALTAPLLRYLEEKAREYIREQLEQVMEKLQRQYRADVLGFGKKVEESYPGWWEEIKGEWRSLFSQAPVSVEVKVTIKQTGMVD